MREYLSGGARSCPAVPRSRRSSDIPTTDDALRARIERQRAEVELSATVLLSSFFGDVAEPRDAFVSVAGVAAVAAPLGVTERSVRTALNRLARDSILVTESTGGRSFYGVSPRAKPTVSGIRRRVFRGERTDAWDGWWTIVAIDSRFGDAGDRSALRQELVWLGLGSFAPNVLVSPAVPAEAAAAVVGRFDGLRVLLTRSQVVGGDGAADDAGLVWMSNDLDEVDRRYRAFEATWRDVARSTGAPDPTLAMAARVLLVSDLRRVVLSDPEMPQELLPDRWAGSTAIRVAAGAFRRIVDASEAFLAQHVSTSLGPMPGRSQEQAGRFPGVPDSS